MAMHITGVYGMLDLKSRQLNIESARHQWYFVFARLISSMPSFA